ncbi:hypothetical protein FA95DRAFT_1677530 [Auriscalpium vulgare]|uniref:Uncharacterized protein n=1 Tax=Auriscalpium vulgare TaxID=40419 RepID=A0ACB8S068_9AGAM|nr:hypothetical protein FA95DRAFT_1677530 [Auriscalpium vulgare]
MSSPLPIPSVTTHDVVEDFRESTLTRYVGVASFSLMVWDHIITFPDEVEYIWYGKKGLLVYLFFLNRYLIPLSFIVNIFAYFYGGWTHESCARFVAYEGAFTMIGISVVGLMMFIRIRALYRRSWLVQGTVIVIGLAYIGVNSWLMTTHEPVFHKAFPLVDSCTMIFHPKVGSIAAASAWLPLLYDTVVVALTLYRTAGAVWTKTAGQIVRVLLQEGLLYYSVICSVTLVLTIMILGAPQGLRNVTAQLELCLTITMSARITLHLKRFAHMNSSLDHKSPAPHSDIAWRSLARPSRVGIRRGRIHHVERSYETSFFAMVSMNRGNGVDEEAFEGLRDGPRSHGSAVPKQVESQAGKADLE